MTITSEIRRLARVFQDHGGTASFYVLHEEGFAPHALRLAGLVEQVEGPGRWDLRFGPAGVTADAMKELHQEADRTTPTK